MEIPILTLHFDVKKKSVNQRVDKQLTIENLVKRCNRRPNGRNDQCIGERWAI